MLSPHHHRNNTNSAVSYPAEFIFKVSLGYHRCVAKVAAHVYLTVRMTVDLAFTIVPAPGFSERTTVQDVVPAPCPVVVKYKSAVCIAATACA